MQRGTCFLKKEVVFDKKYAHRVSWSCQLNGDLIIRSEVTSSCAPQFPKGCKMFRRK